MAKVEFDNIKEWVLDNIRRNHHTKSKAITLIADFLCISREEARKIYAEEFEN